MTRKPLEWFKVEASFQDHPKFYRLKKQLESSSIPDVVLSGLLVNLWALTAQFAPEGDFSHRDQAWFAEKLGWQKGWGDPSMLIKALKSAGYLEKGREIKVHDWLDYQPTLNERERAKSKYEKRKNLQDSPGDSGRLRDSPPDRTGEERTGQKKEKDFSEEKSQKKKGSSDPKKKWEDFS